MGSEIGIRDSPPPLPPPPSPPPPPPPLASAPPPSQSDSHDSGAPGAAGMPVALVASRAHSRDAASLSIHRQPPVSKVPDAAEPMQAQQIDRHLRQLRVLLAQLTPPGSKGSEWLFSRCDNELNRFLRMQRSKVPRAAESLIETSQWRHETGVNNIFFTWAQDMSPEATFIKSYWPAVVLGLSHDGLPVTYNALCNVDFRAFSRIDATDGGSLMSAAVWHNTYLLELAQALDAPRQTGQGRMIFDLGIYKNRPGAQSPSTLRLQDVDYPGTCAFLKGLQRIFAKHYPLYVRQVYFVNAPPFFWEMWAILRKFIPSYIGPRVRVLSGANEQLEDLLKVFPPETIPRRLGGTNDMHIPAGGRIKIPDASRISPFVAAQQSARPRHSPPLDPQPTPKAPLGMAAHPPSHQVMLGRSSSSPSALSPSIHHGNSGRHMPLPNFELYGPSQSFIPSVGLSPQIPVLKGSVTSSSASISDFLYARVHETRTSGAFSINSCTDDVDNDDHSSHWEHLHSIATSIFE